MTLGLGPRQADLFSCTASFCDERGAADGSAGSLHGEGVRVVGCARVDEGGGRMETGTLIRWGIRGVRKAGGRDLAGGLRTVLRRDDDYAGAGKPACDYDDPQAREELVDALGRDAHALLGVLDGQALGPALAQAPELLAGSSGPRLDQPTA